MSDAIKCDACGKVVEREALAFNIEAMSRAVGGTIIDYEGDKHEWNRREVYGDLCGECSEPVIEVLNEVLNNE